LSQHPTQQGRSKINQLSIASYLKAVVAWGQNPKLALAR
jgi:hypothetical protein